MPEIIDNCNQ